MSRSATDAIDASQPLVHRDHQIGAAREHETGGLVGEQRERFVERAGRSTDMARQPRRRCNKLSARSDEHSVNSVDSAPTRRTPTRRRPLRGG